MKSFVEKTKQKEKRLLWRLGEKHYITDLKYIVINGVDWTKMVQDRSRGGILFGRTRQL
jgi:hypothetical protein